MIGFKKLIHDSNLTKTERIIGDYVLDHTTDVCFMTSTNIALSLGVSEASVIRFTKKLGYTGFIEFQKQLRSRYQQEAKQSIANIDIPAKRLKKSRENDSTDYITSYSSIVQRNLTSALHNNPHQTFEKAIDMIVESQHKYILGTRANMGLAADCYITLKRTLPGVISTNTSAASVIDNLIDIEKKDCLIAFSLPRYSKLDKTAITMAKDAGAKIIIITDKYSSPAAAFADVTFVVDIDSNDFFNSFVACYFIVEILCVGISQRTGSTHEKRLKNLDKYLDMLKIY